MATIGAANLECFYRFNDGQRLQAVYFFFNLFFQCKRDCAGVEKTWGDSLIHVQDHRRASELPKLSLKKVSMFIKGILQFLGCLDIVCIWSC